MGMRAGNRPVRGKVLRAHRRLRRYARVGNSVASQASSTSKFSQSSFPQSFPHGFPLFIDLVLSHSIHCYGRGIDSGSAFIIIGNLVVQLVQGVLLVFERRFGLGFSLVFGYRQRAEREYLEPEFTERGPASGRVGPGA